MKKFLPALKAATALLVSFAFLAGSATVLNVIESAEAAPGPFTCTSNFYQVSNGDMYQYSVTNNTYTKMAQSTNVAALNAAGYNTADNYIYAITSTGNGAGKSTTLYKFANDGSHTSLGVLSGGGASIAAGDFIAPNELLTVNGTGHTPLGTFTLIDTNTATTDPNRLSVSAYTSTGSTWAADDFAYNPSNNTIYGIDGTTLYIGTITGSTVAVTTKPVANSGTTGTDAWGATYIDSAGNAYFFDNVNFNLVEISATSLASNNPTALNITQANTLASPNDGASCPTASSPLAPTVVTTTATAVTTTTATLNGTVATGIPASSNITTGNVVMCYSTSNTVVNGALSVSPVCAPTTPSTLPANTAATAVALPVSGLAPGTTYYYQLEATNAYGLEGFGAVNNFVTTAATHTVTFAANGGTGTMADETDNAATALTTNAFTRAGYTFAGWVATPGGTGYVDGASYSFAADATMTAQWTAIPVSTVTFAANGGTGTMAPESNNVPTALTTNTFTRPGYTFAGWVATPGSVAYTDGQTYAFSSNATMTAQWTAIPNRTVTFNSNGGTGSMGVESANVPTALTTNAFTRPGYTFAGWSTAPGGSVVYLDGGTYSFSVSIPLYAQWTAIPASTVTFVANGGTGTMAPEVNNVPTALTTNTFTRPGFTFAGWIASPGGATYGDAQTYAFNSDATMTAQWTAIPNSTVTFVANGGTGTMAPEVQNVPTALTTNTFTRPGYTFAGWVATPGSVAYTDGQTYAFSSNATMTAQWTAIPNSTVTFVANGGTGTMNPETRNVPAALTPNTFTRAGYTFAGWIATPGGAAYSDGQAYQFSSNATMTAQWTAIPDSTVTFVANGGTGTMSPELNNVPAALTANAFTRPGYTFAGWIATPGSTTYTDGQTYAFSSNATMTAQWTAIPASTVTFVANGGTGTMAPESNNVPTALTTNAFTRPGYTFAGWIATPGSTSYTDGQTYAFSSNATMTAQWNAIALSTVTFLANGGTGTMSDESNNVPAALTTNTFTRPGYTFAGWVATPGSVAYTDGQTYAFSSDATMTAQWTAIPNRTVTFNSNGGTGSMGVESANVPTALTTNAFTRPGYTFAGWSTAPGGSVVYLDGGTYSFSVSIPLYAQWTAIPLSTVTFVANGGTGTMAPESNNVPAALTTNTFTRTGFTFAGWDATPGSATYADGDSYAFDADATMTAQWAPVGSKTVTFDANGGTGTMANELNNVPAALTTNAFTRAGYTFAGWVATPGSATYADGDTYAFDADATMTAQWTAIPNSTVTFVANGGTGTMAPEVQNVPTALTTNTFTRPGYTFAGWVATPGSTPYADGDSYAFDADATMTAQWTAIPNSTVTFAANGGTGTMAPESDNVPTALTANTFTRPGYTFAGWVATPGSTPYADGDTYAFDADATMTAQWTAIPASTVTFAANGGTGTMAPESDNVPTALTTNAFTRPGYTFAGWVATPGSTPYADGDSYAFDADATMTAQWTAIPNSTVTFAANGGTGTMAPESDNVPTALTANTFTRPGYTFAGWVATPGSTSYTDGQTYAFTSDATMTAQWTAIPNSTVTFAANGGTGTMAPESDNVPTALTANTFTRAGYTFAGWVATPGGTPYADGDSYAFGSSTTMTAQWTPIGSKSVTFNANGGTGSMAIEINNVPAALTTNTIVRPGFTFAGWATSANGPIVYADGATDPFSANEQLYAQWTAIAVLSFDPNGGTGLVASISANGPTVLPTTTVSRPGYLFTGWNTAEDGSGTEYAPGSLYPLTASGVLFAQFTKILAYTGVDTASTMNLGLLLLGLGVGFVAVAIATRRRPRGQHRAVA